MKTLLIEGWRGINHSYALVNQHQILQMARIPDLRLFHRDLPFAYPRWNTTDNHPGFTAGEQRVINALAEPIHLVDRLDAVYRISAPFRATEKQTACPGLRTMTFMAVEGVLGSENFLSPAHRTSCLAGDDLVVTPSTWSRQRIVEGGVGPDRVAVIPCGVDAARFARLEPEARHTLRARLGVGEEDFLFLNIGGPFWLKGIDLLLSAFAVLKQNGLKVRLFVKDQSALYGAELAGVIAGVGRQDRRLEDQRVLSAISSIPNNLTQEELSNLFGIADCYISPYRAEGFNLPVLEAIASGVPAIVTEGGATDDFCDDVLSIRVPGQFRRRNDRSGIPGAYIEPDFAMLVDAMTTVAARSRPDPAWSGSPRAAVVKRHR